MASQAGRVAAPPADPRLVMPANVSAQAQSRCQAYARGAKPTWACDLGTPEGLDSVVVDRQF
jgi:hypothetical protein